jgi:hypothetical protein
VIKIDVEGAERKVIEGARGTLERFNPLVVVEYNAWTLMAYGDENPLAFMQFLVDRFDYVANLADDGGLVPITRDTFVGFVHDHVTGTRNVDNLVVRRLGSP